VTVCGAVPRGKALRRDGARPGDEIYVSGRLGGSARGLGTGKGKAWRRHIYPEPRLALGRFAREKLAAASAIDISDGLSLDLHRLCLASGVAAEISDPPRFPGATLDQALHGGEEYELVFTVRSGTVVPASFEGLPLTRIGTICKGPSGGGMPGEVRYGDRILPALGYDHFSK
jgi:thiamine-monophosphate kinase